MLMKSIILNHDLLHDLQKIRNVLDENLRDEGDEVSNPETMLYKNLWLEAEASLFSLSFKARFDLVKHELEMHNLNTRG